MATRQELEKALSNPNVRKMLDVIAGAEGVKHGYNTLFGNERTEDLKAHPNIKKEFTQTDGAKNSTTAAGRYQFLKGTWDSFNRCSCVAWHFYCVSRFYCELVLQATRKQTCR